MKIHIFVLLTTFILILVNIDAQDLVWNNKKCAVALTYDDGLNVHLDNVVPALDSLGFKGTFYIPANSAVLTERLGEWRAISKNGHELGNHTIFHPCYGRRPGREWVNPDYDLNDYSITKIVDEIRIANTLLKSIDGKSERTFAYTCGDISAGDSVFVDLILNDFNGARSVTGRNENFKTVNLFDIGSYMIMNNPGEELIKMVKKAQEENALIVFLFHGVGGEHNINVSLSAHKELLKYLKENEKDIWIAPLNEISKFVINSRKQQSCK